MAGGGGLKWAGRHARKPSLFGLGFLLLLTIAACEQPNKVNPTAECTHQVQSACGGCRPQRACVCVCVCVCVAAACAACAQASNWQRVCAWLKTVRKY